MASLFKDPSKLSAYRDRRFPGTQEDFEAALLASTTVYIGNMSFYTTEEQAYELFSRAGEIKKIIMGLDKNTKTPCGFCFVLYYSREDAEDAVKYISGTMLDDRPIRVDFDWGFEEGRQWGRGRSGGQVRDEYRTDYDPDILCCLLIHSDLSCSISSIEHRKAIKCCHKTEHCFAPLVCHWCNYEYGVPLHVPFVLKLLKSSQASLMNQTKRRLR